MSRPSDHLLGLRGGFGNGERDNSKRSSFIPCCPGAIIELESLKSEVGTCKVCRKEVFVGRTLDPPPETVTAEAERLVSDRRGPDYGHPLDNHTATAEMWSAYLRRKYGVKIELDADDVCWMNIFQKASRDANAPKRDNLTDTAGYALNIDMIRAERDRRGSL